MTKEEENANMTRLYSGDQTILTRRLVLGVASGQFDMLGMASPLLIKLRVSMRDLFVKEIGLSWDTALPAKLRDT